MAPDRGQVIKNKTTKMRDFYAALGQLQEKLKASEKTNPFAGLAANGPAATIVIKYNSDARECFEFLKKKTDDSPHLILLRGGGQIKREGEKLLKATYKFFKDKTNGGINTQ